MFFSNGLQKNGKMIIQFIKKTDKTIYLFGENNKNRQGRLTDPGLGCTMPTTQNIGKEKAA